MSFDGISKVFTKSEDESLEHLKNVCSDLPQENQVINIVEAAMINYFKPEYNINFVENFPDENHRGYRQYFDLDYNSLTVEVDLDFDNTPSIQLYTELLIPLILYDIACLMIIIVKVCMIFLKKYNVE